MTEPRLPTIDLTCVPTEPKARARYIDELRKRYQEGTLDLSFGPDDVPDTLLQVLFPAVFGQTRFVA